MKELAEFLIQNNISISSVESFTVGNFAASRTITLQNILQRPVHNK